MKMMKKTDAWGVSSSSLCRHGAMALTPPAITARFMSSLDESPPTFQRGDSILIEVMSFGPLGASVQVVGLSHSPNALITDDEDALGRGLILQKEIHYFRQARENVDIVNGEVLPAYVERVRDNGRLDISLRPPGGKQKAEDIGKLILERLQDDGTLQLGDKSCPRDIEREFPGVSKLTFKKAVSALYKKGLVQPSADSITLVRASKG
jgi:CvfB-like winged helix domain